MPFFVIHIVNNGLEKFCKEYNISRSAVGKMFDNNKRVNNTIKGWLIRKIIVNNKGKEITIYPKISKPNNISQTLIGNKNSIKP